MQVKEKKEYEIVFLDESYTEVIEAYSKDEAEQYAKSLSTNYYVFDARE